MRRPRLAPIALGVVVAAISCKQDLDVLSAGAVDRDGGAGASIVICDPCGLESACEQDCSSGASIAAIAAGSEHVCAIQSRNLYCWGDNSDGQLATGDSVLRTSPTRVGNVNDWFAVAAGDAHSCAIRTSGLLYCWGANDRGQLGIGDTRPQPMPTEVGHYNDFRQIACGGDNCCALRRGGELLCWGSNQEGRAGVDAEGDASITTPTPVGGGARFVAVRVSATHSCAIRQDGALFCWGSDQVGELGLGGAGAFRPAPVQVGSRSDWAILALGTEHSCALTRDRGLFCWGSDRNGQIGVGSQGDDADLAIAEPTMVGAGDWLGVAAGAYHNCARKRMQMYCWGRADSGQLDGTPGAFVSTPTAVATETNLRRLALGNDFSCGFDTANQLYCWGDNRSGELGAGDSVSHAQPVSVSF